MCDCGRGNFVRTCTSASFDLLWLHDGELYIYILCSLPYKEINKTCNTIRVSELYKCRTLETRCRRYDLLSKLCRGCVFLFRKNTNFKNSSKIFSWHRIHVVGWSDLDHFPFLRPYFSFQGKVPISGNYYASKTSMGLWLIIDFCKTSA
jgi:hypothetical protein